MFIYEDVYVFIPDERKIIRISEGTGDNLLDEDIAAGYVDYIYYSIFDMNNDLAETDGGMILLEQMFREKYSSPEDSVGDVIEFIFGFPTPRYIVLSNKAIKTAISDMSYRNPMSIKDDGAFGMCPKCGAVFNSELINEYNIKCCPYCGQVLSEYYC